VGLNFPAANAECNIAIARGWLATAESREDMPAASLLLGLIDRWQFLGLRRDEFVLRLADRVYRAHCVIAKLAERKEVRAK